METSIHVELKRSERELLLNLLHIDPEVEKRVVHARPAANRFPLDVDRKEMDGLLAAIASEANHTDDRNMQKAYEELRERLERLEPTAVEGGSAPA
jgi:hypothetical protein